MNAIRRRIVRVQRMQTIEQNQLNVLAVELATVQSRIRGHQDQIQELAEELNSLAAFNNSHTLALHRQSTVWAMGMQRKTSQLEEQIVELEGERDELLDRVLAAKTKIKGWESLVEKLTQEDSQIQADAEAAIADDMYLIKQKR